MGIGRLIVREILHRKLNFALATVSVVVAVGVLVAEVTLLKAHDVCTEELLARKQAEAKKRLAALEDDYRKYMKELGFNLLILPKEQDLAEFWERGYASHTMPEAFVDTLSRSGTVLIRHLLPIIQQKVFWPEQKRRIVLIGTRGEVPLAHRRPKEAILQAVPPGKAVVGGELAEDLGLKRGDSLQLMGREFTVWKVQPTRGSIEDVTIWLHLADAQALLKMEGRINGIEALKCHCEGVTFDQLKAEVAGYLNNQVRVVVRENKVTLRAKARDRARAESIQALAAEARSRAELRQTREEFAAVVVPLVLLGAGVWIGLLALSNVRERSAEIGILRAIGVRSGRIFALFLLRALLVGLLGAAVGYAGGLLVSIAAARSMPSLMVHQTGRLVEPWLPAVAIAVAPALSILAGWAPATIAARQDPAEILARE